MLCGFVQLFFIDMVVVMQRVPMQKRAANGVVPDFIHIPLSTAGVPRVKIERHFFAGKHSNVRRQKVIERAQKALRRDIVRKLHAQAEFPRVYAGIRTAARLDVRLRVQNLL